MLPELSQSDKLLVVDVESTCWKDAPPPGEQSEIIEIGLCLLDVTTRQPEGKRSVLVRPSRSKVSAFCTRLTTLTQTDVNQGMHFWEACLMLQEEYQSSSRVWASWGEYDRKQFQWQCASFGVPYPFSEQHINAKKLFAEKHTKGRQVGMARALQILKLPLDGTHHRGHDDAWNIARILTTLL
ncbi:MAG TPA: 3'-5' exonuclease [Chloroflexota bacterium]|nr:3'-5' exonuclease [Chloroflexota bacterium]